MNRRSLVQMLAAAPLLAAAGGSAFAEAAATSIARLIAESRTVPEAQASVSERMDFISRALLGIRYQANTLIGGPRRREQFVDRDDAFDCVTFCEFVLAAALARDYEAFEAALKRIRYANGTVRWDERNHYFADWSRRVVENEICWPVELPKSITIDKTVNWRNLGRRQIAMLCVPVESLLVRPSQLKSSDIVGFLSRRSSLDFFHTGFVMVGPKGELILRHASQSRGRVLDEPLDGFVAVNRVRHATLLRVAERQS